MSGWSGFLHSWGRGALTVYVSGILLPVIVAVLRDELMIMLGVPAYTVVFWTGPFASAAAVTWSGWSAWWRVAWVLLVPGFAAAPLGLVLILMA